MSIHTTDSQLGDETYAMISYLDTNGMSLLEICEELKMVFGNTVISNRRDRYLRTALDFPRNPVPTPRPEE